MSAGRGPHGWRDLVAPGTAPRPFDKPGPPRPVQRWLVQVVTPEGEEVAALVSQAADAESAKRLLHETGARRWALDQGIAVPRDYFSGDGWVVSQFIDAGPPEGLQYVTAAAEAAAAIGRATAPPPPAVTAWAGSRRSLLLRVVRGLAGGLPMREFRAVRAEAAQLPADSWNHGDFSDANVLAAPGGVAVIDWEFAARGPSGRDEMRLWATLAREEDRTVLMELLLDRPDGPDQRLLGIEAHWQSLLQLAQNLSAGRGHRDARHVASARVAVVEARRWRRLLDPGYRG